MRSIRNPPNSGAQEAPRRYRTPSGARVGWAWPAWGIGREGPSRDVIDGCAVGSYGPTGRRAQRHPARGTGSPRGSGHPGQIRVPHLVP